MLTQRDTRECHCRDVTKRVVTLLVAVLLFTLMTVQSRAQYFGRNKVQYEEFDFQILKTENLDIYHYPAIADVASAAGQMGERWRTRLGAVMNYELNKRQPIILYASHADFQQSNVISGLISQGTGGVTEGMKNRVVVPMTGVLGEFNHVLGHELVHAFQFRLMKQQGARRLPLWFTEGIAEYLSLGDRDTETAMWLRDAVLHDDMPTLSDMTSDLSYFPYRFGHAFWAYIGGKYGDRTVGALYQSALRHGVGGAVRKILNTSTDSLSIAWHASVRDTYTSQLEGLDSAAAVGTTLFADEFGMNLSPSISPNGRYLTFLSRRDVFTLDLYVADVQSGEIVDKLISSNTDEHFDALRFFNASGSWSPDGSQLAYVVFEDGDNEIAIIDIPSGDVARRIDIPEIDAITGVSWSPDGERLALAGASQGYSNLYLYRLADGAMKQLTDDRYAELQPAWSPDGQTVTCITDNVPGTDLTTYTFGPMQIGLIDVGTGELSILDIHDGARHVNPQFSSDGRHLYFVSDPDGISNIYRYSLDTRETVRLTNVATGVSGLTGLSPALTVAQNTDDIAFSLFDERGYRIHFMTDPAMASTTPLAGPRAIPPEMPPIGGEPTIVNTYLSEPSNGLVSDRDFTITDYDPSLSLAYAGRTSIGVSVDRFGTGLGGGASLVFSDMLGNRLLGVTAQLNGGIKDAGGEVFYMNRRHQLNWGALAGHIPYQTIGYTVGQDTVTIDGEQVLAREDVLIRERIFNDRVSVMGSYPLSTNRRLEATAGYTRVSYNIEADRVTSVNGVVVDSRTVDRDAPSGLNLFQSSLAYVGDYSRFGFTSPAAGRRFRVEIEPTLGTLNYATVLLDYRHYFFLKPFTVAFRGLHHGRYFGDSDSERLSDDFLGYETLVRGYASGSISPSECVGDHDSGTCPQFDRLVGNRIAVFNAELRMPLFGTEEFGVLSTTVLPTELALFFDGGVAWSAGNEPTLKFATHSNERIPVFSAGAAARFNILGYIVTQFYLAFPFQRPEQDTQFGFVIAPGW